MVLILEVTQNTLHKCKGKQELKSVCSHSAKATRNPREYLWKSAITITWDQRSWYSAQQRRKKSTSRHVLISACAPPGPAGCCWSRPFMRSTEAMRCEGGWKASLDKFRPVAIFCARVAYAQVEDGLDYLNEQPSGTETAGGHDGLWGSLLCWGKAGGGLLLSVWSLLLLAT